VKNYYNCCWLEKDKTKSRFIDLEISSTKDWWCI